MVKFTKEKQLPNPLYPERCDDVDIYFSTYEESMILYIYIIYVLRWYSGIHLISCKNKYLYTYIYIYIFQNWVKLHTC